MTTVSMTDGREVDFGKRDYLLSTCIESDGSVTLKAAFADGEYREFNLPLKGDGKGLNAALSAYAAAGLEATAKRFLNGGLSHDFDVAVGLWSQGPSAKKPRVTAGPKPSPLELATMEVTGKPLEAIRPWLASKTRKERFALSKDPRIAVVIVRLAAEKEAAKASKDGSDVADPLAELGVCQAE